MNGDAMGGHGLASAARGTRHVFLRDMLLGAHIGVHAHEHGEAQRVRINVDLAVAEGVGDGGSDGVGADDLARVVDYEAVARRVRSIVQAGHVKLVETLAERIADAVLGSDLRIRLARIRIEKLDVFPDAASAGVEVERARAG